MSLTKCTECDHQISTLAVAWPSPGRPAEMLLPVEHPGKQNITVEPGIDSIKLNQASDIIINRLYTKK